MKLDNNPFEYEAANNLSDEMIATYYSDDFNYSRFIQSNRNIFLVGERGTGKTMALLYNRWRVQRLLAAKRKELPASKKIGIYVPCNTPLTHKTEYQLLDNELLRSALSEHFLVLSMTYCLAETLADEPEFHQDANDAELIEQANFVLGVQLPKARNFFESVMRFLQQELRNTQRKVNNREVDSFYEQTFSFVSGFVPLLNLCAKRIPALQGSHFLLLLDDAHTLNDYQNRLLNSWIAYRDHSLFSFKAAIAKVSDQKKVTATGGSILEGHDYTSIDLEAPLQNSDTRYYHLARKIVKKRLENVSIDRSPEEFFPVSESMTKDLEKSEIAVRTDAISKFGDSDARRKAINDYVYKYKRVDYFRKRSSRANKPPYSGFETLVFLSTGVIRNLLEPCYWMFDRVVSEGRDGASASLVKPNIQTDIILDRSHRKWEWLRDQISLDIEDCSTEDGGRAYRLLDALAKYFRHRLLYHGSEPSALSFTISGRETPIMEKLSHLLDILRKAQLLYVRSGSAKDIGGIENYYVPNRILWPARGLDPHGQHARVSIQARVLWQAAESGAISIDVGDEGQGRLWDDA